MSLYRLEKERDFEAIQDYLRFSDNPNVRARAARILGSSSADPDQSHGLIDTLISSAMDDSDPTVRAAAIDALDQIGVEAVKRLIANLSDPSNPKSSVTTWDVADSLSSDIPELRMAAANVLGQIGDSGALDTLIDALSDPDDRVRIRVARAIGSIGHPGAVHPLVSALTDSTVEVRKAAAESIGRIGTREAMSALIERVDDSNEMVRYVAISGLGEANSPRPIPALIDALDDESRMVRTGAMHSIISLLSNAPSDQGHSIRMQLVNSVKGIDDPGMVEPLLEIIETGVRDPYVRNAAWLLGHIVTQRNEARAIDALISLLDREDPLTVQMAVSSLMEIGGKTAESRLLSVIDDESVSPEIRSKVIFVLGKIGGALSEKQLESIRKHTDNEAIRRQATSAIVKMGGEI